MILESKSVLILVVGLVAWSKHFRLVDLEVVQAFFGNLGHARGIPILGEMAPNRWLE